MFLGMKAQACSSSTRRINQVKEFEAMLGDAEAL